MPTLEAIPKSPSCGELLQTGAFPRAMRDGLLASAAHVDHVRDFVVELPHASCIAEGLATDSVIEFRARSAVHAGATDALKDPALVAAVATL